MQRDTRDTGKLPHPLLSSSHWELGKWDGNFSEACWIPKGVLSTSSHAKTEIYFLQEQSTFASLLHLGPKQLEMLETQSWHKCHSMSRPA